MKTTKPLITLFILTGIFSSCQKQQVFNQSPEIDLVKQSIDAAIKGDWSTYRSLFHDTAEVYINDWFHKRITPDQYIENLKSHFNNVASFNVAPNSIYEMVVTTEGKHWVHLWTELIYVLKDGQEVRTPDHSVIRVENNKIVFFGGILNSLPRYLAEQSIQKGSLLGIHSGGTITLKPGVTLEQFNEFILTKYLPASDKAFPGTKSFLIKAIRGEKEGSFGTMVIFNSEQERNKYYNNDGSANEEGKAAQQRMQDALDEFGKLVATYKGKYTDWVVQ